MHIIQALTTISDLRRRYCPLSGLLTIVLRAAMHGERSLRGMWFWARARQDDLRTHPALGVRAVRRIPSLVTFGSAGRNTPAGERERAPVPLLLAERDLALDGTWRRGSTRDATDALRIVTRAGETVGQVWTHRAVPHGDEVAAAPALPETFPLGRPGHRRRRRLGASAFRAEHSGKKGPLSGGSRYNQPDLYEALVHGSGMPSARAPDGVDGQTPQAGRAPGAGDGAGQRLQPVYGAAGLHGRAGAPDRMKRAATAGWPARRFPGRWIPMRT